LTMEAFEEIFVTAFSQSTTRRQLFENYLGYVQDFKAMLTPNFTQWINGSFVTKKNQSKGHRHGYVD